MQCSTPPMEGQFAPMPPDWAVVLAESLVALAPGPDRVRALRARILDRARPKPTLHASPRVPTGLITVRAAAGEWRHFSPGVSIKMCHDEGTVQSFMLRLDAGASLPAHSHHADEMCLVMSGGVTVGSLTMQAGDYHLAPSGTPHGTVSTREGCVLFIRTGLVASASPRTS